MTFLLCNLVLRNTHKSLKINEILRGSFLEIILSNYLILLWHFAGNVPPIGNWRLNVPPIGNWRLNVPPIGNWRLNVPPIGNWRLDVPLIGNWRLIKKYLIAIE